MLYQSLKSIHYRTLSIFQNKKKNPTDLRVKTRGGGNKRNVIPPTSKHGGIYHPHSPQDLRPWYHALYYVSCFTQLPFFKVLYCKPLLYCPYLNYYFLFLTLNYILYTI